MFAIKKHLHKVSKVMKNCQKTSTAKFSLNYKFLICNLNINLIAEVLLKIFYADTLDTTSFVVIWLVDTAWKVSVFGDFLLRIFLCSVRMRQKMDQKNSEYGHFSPSITDKNTNEYALQTRNQELFRWGEIFLELGHFDKH